MSEPAPASTDAIDETFDVVVVGAGAAGLTAASIAAAEGCAVLLLEQADVVGGTTAISGGMVWLPVNHKAAAEGRADSLEAARTYLAQTVPGDDRTRLEAFLAHADAALRDLEARTALRLQPVPTYPDYYPDLPGATAGGRVLEPVPFDACALGDAFALLNWNDDGLDVALRAELAALGLVAIEHQVRLEQTIGHAEHQAALVTREPFDVAQA